MNISSVSTACMFLELQFQYYSWFRLHIWYSNVQPFFYQSPYTSLFRLEDRHIAQSRVTFTTDMWVFHLSYACSLMWIPGFQIIENILPMNVSYSPCFDESREHLPWLNSQTFTNKNQNNVLIPKSCVFIPSKSPDLSRGSSALLLEVNDLAKCQW